MNKAANNNAELIMQELQLEEIEQDIPLTNHQKLMECYRKLNEKIDAVLTRRKKSFSNI
jgi:hypothetical protein